MKDRRVLVLLAGFYLVALVFRVEFLFHVEAAQTLAQHAGEKALIEGVVVNDPERRATSLHAHIKVSSVDGTPATGKLLAILPREARLEYGDSVAVRGGVELPQAFETDTGRVFDYPNYLRVRGISATMRYGSIESTEEGKWSIPKTLFALKHAFSNSIERVFPEPNASLLEGVLLGERRGLPEELTDAFITSSLIHVVVLSGYNISIVSEAVLRATSFLPAATSYTVGGIFIVFFAVMTGAGATTVRACIMGLIAILARVLHRPAAALRALLVAALAMVLWNPLVLFHDPSFILSVLATFGLITFSPWVERHFTWVPVRFGLRSIAASTAAVQLFILPALLYMSGVLSFFALPANVLALPVVPLAMLMGFAAGLFGLAHQTLAQPFSIVTNMLLDWMMLVANTTHAFPFSSTIVSAFPFWVVVAVYVPLTLLALRLYRSEIQSHPSSNF